MEKTHIEDIIKRWLRDINECCDITEEEHLIDYRHEIMIGKLREARKMMLEYCFREAYKIMDEVRKITCEAIPIRDKVCKRLTLLLWEMEGKVTYYLITGQKLSM